MPVCFGQLEMFGEIPGVAPGAPVLEVKDAGVEFLELSWTPGADADYYELEVSTDAEFTSLFDGYDGLALEETHHEVTGLVDNTPYFARVRAVNAFGQAVSNVVEAPRFVCSPGQLSSENKHDFEDLEDGIAGIDYQQWCVDGAGPSYVLNADNPHVEEDYSDFSEGTIETVPLKVMSRNNGSILEQYFLSIEPPILESTDFSEHELNELPSGWLSRWVSGNWTVADVDGNRVVKVTNSLNRRRGLSRDTDWHPGDLEIRSRFRVTSSGATSAETTMGLFLRGTGSGTDVTNYLVVFRGNGSVEIGKYDGGSFSVLDEEADVGFGIGVWMNVIFRAEGDRLRAKVWTGELDDPPSSWLLDVTDTMQSQGWFGLWAFAGEEYEWSDFQVESL